MRLIGPLANDTVAHYAAIRRSTVLLCTTHTQSTYTHSVAVRCMDVADVGDALIDKTHALTGTWKLDL